MQRYDTYKDSGVKWLGEIPSHWEVRKNKYLFRESDERNVGRKYQLLSFSKSKGIIPYNETNDKEYSAEDISSYKVLHVGQLLENRLQAWNGMFASSKIEGCVSPDYSVFNPIGNQVNVDYYAYLFRTDLYIEQWANASKGVGAGFNRLYTPQFGSIYSLFPPRNEQDAIVSYLDEKMAKIDAAIAQQQKMIDLLNERKQIIINRAVTKGLNPNAKMKDSGVEWIGEVPEGWEIVTLKRLAGGFSNGTSLSQLSNGETPYRVSRIETISSGRINYDKTGFVKYDSTLPKYKMALNDILISNINSFERIGNSAIYNGEESLYHGMNLLRIKPNTDVVPQYLITYLKSSLFSLQMKLACKPAVNQVSVPSSSVKNMLVVLPSISEQHKLVDYCFSKIEEIEVAIKGANNQISLLQERKQIIINEVVTGKVKVM